MTKNTAQIVPVGTADNAIQVISPAVQNYLDRYNLAIKKTAQAVLDVACTVFEAKNQLSPVDFTVFLREVGFDEDSSTYKKFIVIADKKQALEPYLEKLPNAWTTIYQLAKLKPDQFEEVANSGMLTPFVTANTINNIVRGGTTDTAKVETDVFINVKSLCVDTQYEFYRELEILCKKFNASPRLAKPFIKLMADCKQKGA